MRIVFLGTAAFAVPALRAITAAGHEVPVVVTQPDRARGRSKRPQPSAVKVAALELGVPGILQPERLKKRTAREALEALGPFDVGVVAAYGQILTRQALSVPRLGMFNLHASLLPRWRGAAPVPRAILAGDPETGVSCQRMVSALDAGPVVALRATPIDEEDTTPALLERLAAVGAKLCVEVLAGLEAGTLTETPQEESEVTLAPIIAKAEGQLDWRRDAAWISRHIRAMQPWPRSFTDLYRVGGGAPLRVILGAASAVSAPEAAPGSSEAAAGEVLRAEGSDLVVACGGGTALQIRHVQPAGKRSMPVEAWLRGRPVAPGDRFGSGAKVKA